jgi:hypothetical protein
MEGARITSFDVDKKEANTRGIFKVSAIDGIVGW